MKIPVKHEMHDMSFDKTTKRGKTHLKATKDARGKHMALMAKVDAPNSKGLDIKR